MIAPLIVTPDRRDASAGTARFVFTGLLGAAWLVFWRITGTGVDRTAEDRRPPCR